LLEAFMRIKRRQPYITRAQRTFRYRLSRQFE
jgi:hypothetical protein